VARLLLLFTLVPLVELILLLELGGRTGTLPTLGLIVATGIAGAFLAKWQGLGVLRRIQTELGAGRMPGAAIVDGAIVLVAGALLVTPGVLTDIVGFLCLVPATRAGIREMLWRALGRAVREGRARVHVQVDEWPPEPPPRPPVRPPGRFDGPSFPPE
jgi:UPF0716 protein FxsA